MLADRRCCREEKGAAAALSARVPAGNGVSRAQLLARTSIASASEGIMGAAPPRSAECGAALPTLPSHTPPPCSSILAHSDPLEPPEEATLVARVLKAGVYRQQQPIGPARGVRMPPSCPRAHLERRCSGALTGSTVRS